MRGFININKPSGMTSNDVVVKVRGALKCACGDKKLKVGHLGTLDPLATGVLPVAVGSATKLFDLLLNKQKTYIATFKFGETTDTLDRDGQIIETCDIDISDESIARAIESQTGEIWQTPPQYSAKSVGGKRAYDIAREGGTAELSPKKVTVYSIEPTRRDDLGHNEYRFEIVCSSGTYIRAIARDMAREMGTVGYMTSLVRTASGPFELYDSVTFEKFATDPLKYVLPIEYALGDMPAIRLDESAAVAAFNGVKTQICAEDGIYRVTRDGVTAAIGDVENNMLKLRIRL